MRLIEVLVGVIQRVRQGPGTHALLAGPRWCSMRNQAPALSTLWAHRGPSCPPPTQAPPPTLCSLASPSRPLVPHPCPQPGQLQASASPAAGDPPAPPHLLTCPALHPAAQRKALPRSCCDLGCHVYLRGHCGQQHPQRGDVQVPGGAPSLQGRRYLTADSAVGPARLHGPGDRNYSPVGGVGLVPEQPELGLRPVGQWPF